MDKGLPSRLSRLFWDVSFGGLNVKRHAVFIIERLLEKGDWRAVRWVWRTYPQEVIFEVISSSRNLSLTTRSLWQRLLSHRQPTRHAPRSDQRANT